MRIAVNTISTKKHSGGAYQIAYNFLLETLQHQEEDEWYYITSSDVDELVGKEFHAIRDSRYFVFPTQPDFKGSYKRVKKELVQWEEKYKPDVIYTISSPCYFSFKNPEVMRFANAWITNPNRMAWQSMPWSAWLRMRLYRINQIRLLKKANYIITQSETVKAGLVKILGLPENDVAVVPNVLPKIFLNAIVDKRIDDKWIDVNCASAPSPHKNLAIIPDVIKELRDRHGIHNVRFHLTIPEDNAVVRSIVERCASMGMKENVINHGRCTQRELIPIYNRCSICFLPTLLETFSASSLEAMYFEQYIVATDFDFNREVIGESGLYYIPMNPTDAAKKINEIINDKELQIILLKKMKDRIQGYNSYSTHFNKTVIFLKEVINK